MEETEVTGTAAGHDDTGHALVLAFIFGINVEVDRVGNAITDDVFHFGHLAYLCQNGLYVVFQVLGLQGKHHNPFLLPVGQGIIHLVEQQFVRREPGQCDTTCKEHGDDQLQTDHRIAERVPFAALLEEGIQGHLTQLAQREADNEQADRHDDQVNLQLGQIDILQTDIGNFVHGQKAVCQAECPFRQQERKKQGGRHHQDDFRCKQAIQTFGIGTQTLAQGQFALAVEEHLDGELQEVDQSRHQNEGDNQQKQQLGKQGLSVLATFRLDLKLYRFALRIGPGNLFQ